MTPRPATMPRTRHPRTAMAQWRKARPHRQAPTSASRRELSTFLRACHSKSHGIDLEIDGVASHRVPRRPRPVDRAALPCSWRSRDRVRPLLEVRF